MKNLGAFVSISATTGEEEEDDGLAGVGRGGNAGRGDHGQMKLCVETDLVTVTTHFRDLGRPTWNPSSSQRSPRPADREGRDSAGFAEARINIRKLAQFLSGQLINPPKIICNIADRQMLHLFILHEDVSLQVFMPSVNS